MRGNHRANGRVQRACRRSRRQRHHAHQYHVNFCRPRGMQRRRRRFIGDADAGTRRAWPDFCVERRLNKRGARRRRRWRLQRHGDRHDHRRHRRRQRHGAGASKHVCRVQFHRRFMQRHVRRNGKRRGISRRVALHVLLGRRRAGAHWHDANTRWSGGGRVQGNCHGCSRVHVHPGARRGVRFRCDGHKYVHCRVVVNCLLWWIGWRA